MAGNLQLRFLAFPRVRPSAATNFAIRRRVQESHFLAQGGLRKLTGEMKGVLEWSNKSAELGAALVRRKESLRSLPFFSSLSVQSIDWSPLLTTASTEVIKLAVVFVAGFAYFKLQRRKVFKGVWKAFNPEYDPVLELATRSIAKYSMKGDGRDMKHPRKEQQFVDHIISGKGKGQYYMLLGSKGVGKAAMIHSAMRKIEADGVAFCDAHPDLEVFRQRLGKALNYKFNEDTLTALFKRRDPREGGPASDIERALNTLEKVALRRERKTKKPIVLIINNVHFFQHTDESRNLLLQLQQRAEAWAESEIATVVFTSDDFWPYFVLRKSARLMLPRSIYDLDREKAEKTFCSFRQAYQPREANGQVVDTEKLAFVGGRFSFLKKVAQAHNMSECVDEVIVREKGWLHSQIGLTANSDKNLSDEQKIQQKRRSLSWMLLREFVRIYKEHEAAEGKKSDGFFIPSIPYEKARQIIKQPDLIDDLDRNNIISIDIDYTVRPDSMIVLQAAKELIDSEKQEINEIESTTHDGAHGSAIQQSEKNCS